MVPFLVVFEHPGPSDLSNFVQMTEQPSVEYLRAIGSIESFDVGVLTRILHEQCEVEVFWVWSDKPGLQGLHGVHDRLFRHGLADFGHTSPNPRCLSTCRGSTRKGSGGVQANGHHTEQFLVRTGTAQQ